MQRHQGPDPLRVVIVGGGAAAVITAIHLMRAASAARPVEVHIVEKGPRVGPGLAYRTEHPSHLLNNYAARLSAVDGEPDHLVRWCGHRGITAEPTSFLPRQVYGAYLADALAAAQRAEHGSVTCTRGVVTDVVRLHDRLHVQVGRAGALAADKVVLALGNPPPRRERQLERRGDAYVGDPWVPDLVERIGGASDVLLLGTGLTMVDVVAQLHHALPMTRFTAVSRRGLLPAAHRRSRMPVHGTFHPGHGSLETVVGAVHARIEEVSADGGDWRDVVDPVRASANDLWGALSPDDQARFAADVARTWEVARHRMPPRSADLIRDLLRSGRLRVRRTDQVDVARFPRVVSCTGPAPVPSRGWNPLVDRLLDRGTIRAHRLGLGLDVDLEGHPVGGDGEPDEDIFVVGAARRGVEWEVSAVPDLRSQAMRITAQLLAGTAALDPPSSYGVLA